MDMPNVRLDDRRRLLKTEPVSTREKRYAHPRVFTKSKETIPQQDTRDWWRTRFHQAEYVATFIA